MKTTDDVVVNLVRSEQEIFDDLAQLCIMPGFIHAIVWFCIRDNFISYGDELKPKNLTKLYGSARLIRTEITTLIGLAVKSELDFTPQETHVYKAYCDRAEALLEELHSAMCGSWLDDFKAMTEGKASTAGLAEINMKLSGSSLREPIFYGGDSAYSFQYCDFATLKYSSDEKWLLKNKGFTMEAAKSVALAIQEAHNEKANKAVNAVKAKESHLLFLAAFEFSVPEIAKRTGLEVETVKRVVEAFTKADNDRNDAFKSMSDYNVVSGAPILRHGENYLLLDYYNIVSAMYETPIYWMTADPSYVEVAFKNRANFSEQFAYMRLAAVFGTGNVFLNVEIPGTKGKTLGEIDALVVFGGLAIVVQAKTRRLSIAARKGNDLHIKKDFRFAVQEAYDQAFQCGTLLLDPGTVLLDSDKNPLELSIPVTQVFPICLLADHYPALSFQAREFLNTSEHPNVLPPLVIDVFALDAIAEMLESPLRFLSYLKLRGRFGHKLSVSHELTLLSDHIKRNLWVSDQYDFVVLSDDIAVDLDIAMMVRREGIQGKRTPDGILTRFVNSPVGRLLKYLESNPQPANVDLGLFLLELNEKSFAALSMAISKIVADTCKDGKEHDVHMSFGEAGTGLTLYCLPQWNIQRANQLRAHCTIKKYQQKASSWYGLVYDPAGELRLSLKLNGQWKFDFEIEKALALMPKLHPVTDSEFYRYLRKDIKVGRNEPCPCGSGRKYKKCCHQR